MARKNKSNPQKRQQNKSKKKNPEVIVKTVTVPQQMGIGAMIGDKLQRFAESTFARLMGRGDYALQEGIEGIKKNSLFSDSPKRAFTLGTNGSSLVIEHSEYVGPVVSSDTIGAFTQKTYPMDPTNPSSFPWLSSLAVNFEQYEVLGLVYRLETASGAAISGSDSALGTWISTFQYDPTNEPYTNKQQMLQSYGSVSSVVCKSQLMGVECAKDSLVFDKLYCRESDASTETRFYSKGNFVVASQGLKAASQVVGDLWVHYKIKFINPKTPTLANDIIDSLFVKSSSPDYSHTIDWRTLYCNFYSSSLGVEDRTGTAGGGVWVNGLEPSTTYVLTYSGTYTNSATITCTPAKIQGGVTDIYSDTSNAGGGASSNTPITTVHLFTTPASIHTNQLYITAACIYSSGGTTSNAGFFRLVPVPNYDGKYNTQASQLN
nr:structural protein [Tolivirales sp.]